VRQLGGAGHREHTDGPAHEDALLISVLTAFPDRVARRRQGADLQLANGTNAQLAPNSTVSAGLLVAVEAGDRKDQRAPLVRLASSIEPEWLLDLFPGRLRETSTLEWHRAGERVEATTRAAVRPDPDRNSSHRAGPRCRRRPSGGKAVEAGLARFADVEEITAFQARIKFAAQYGAVPALGEEAIEGALASLAAGLKSFAELEVVAGKGGLLRAIERGMPAQARRLMDELAPTAIRLPRGRQVRVHYEAGQPPWIASRLQDFFGMRQGPSVARGASPLVIRLLGPNQRPVQMTTDLAGFWERLYPQVRRELARRYPRHAWPEDPLK